MAVLVAVAGAGIGASLAGTIGLSVATAMSWGFTIGGTVGNWLFPQKDTSQGPRLNDLSVTSSTYGSARPVAFGTIRLAGNLIWVKGNQIQEIRVTGGKGGGKKSEDQYRYVATFAISFAEGVADDVLRVWADGKLILDKRTESINTTKAGLNYRFYRGTRTQVPDASYVADVGAHRAPAFRGTCYMVFDNLELADYGNRIPNITAEITFAKQPVTLAKAATMMTGQDLNSFSPQNVGFDPLRGYAYLVDADLGNKPPGPPNYRKVTYTGIRKIQAFTTEMFEVDQRPTWVALNQRPYPPRENVNDYTQMTYGPVFVTKTGHIVVTTASRYGTVRPLHLLEPNSLTTVGVYGNWDNLIYGIGPGGAAPLNHIAEMSLYGPTQRWDFLFIGDFNNSLGLIRLPSMTWVWSASGGSLLSERYTYNLCAGRVGAMQSEGWAIQGHFYSYSSYPYLLRKVKISGITETEYWNSTNLMANTTDEIYHTFYPQDIFPGATGWASFGAVMAYCPHDNSLILSGCPEGAGPLNERIFKYDIESKQVVWVSKPLPGAGYWLRAKLISQTLEGSTLGIVNFNGGWLIDTNSGEILSQENYTIPGIAESPFAHHGYYDPRSETFYNATSESYTGDQGSGLARFYFRKGDGAGVTLAEIVYALCLKVGLEPHQIDVTDLTSTVIPGYLVGNQSTSRSVIDNLRATFLFDGADSDFKIKFVMRGKDSVRTLTEDDFLMSEEIIKENRTQEIELPQKVGLSYLNRDQDYNSGTQASQRILEPLASMSSRNVIEMQLSGALTDIIAKRQAEKILKEAWNSRTNFTFQLPWKHLDLDATDVVTLRLNKLSADVRLTGYDWADEMVLDAQAVTQLPGQYQSSAIPVSREPLESPEIAAPVFIDLVFFDTPLLRDTDEPYNRAYTMVYYAALPTHDNFQRANVFYSVSGLGYRQVDTVLSYPAWGVLMSVLPDLPRKMRWTTDYRNDIDVVIVVGGDSLESVNYQEMLSGSNGALILKANGEVEVIQYMNVQIVDNNKYRLSGILRGCRGTETMAHNYAGGERIIFLNESGLRTMDTQISDLNSVRYYKGVSIGQYLDDIPPQTVKVTGRALMPYAPHPLRAEESGGDILLSWLRRTRYAGNKDNSYPVILGEDEELYDLQIFDGPDGLLVREVNDLTSLSYNYTSAQQSLDGQPSPMRQITIKVFQRSGQVGRGFAKEETIDVQ